MKASLKYLAFVAVLAVGAGALIGSHEASSSEKEASSSEK